jgi:hypothetical protein
VLGVAQDACDGEAVGAGEHAVEDDDVDLVGAGLRCGEEISESGVSVGFMVSAKALGLEIEEQALGEVFFIFDACLSWLWFDFHGCADGNDRPDGVDLVISECDASGSPIEVASHRTEPSEGVHLAMDLNIAAWINS